jgi:uncharacterized membrane protein YdbT with pleckstrin-like domain
LRLEEGEHVLLAMRPGTWVVGAYMVVTLGLYTFWLRATVFVLTDRRVIARRGILNKEEIALPLHFIQDAAVDRSWIGIGRVKISTAGGSSGKLQMWPLSLASARRLADAIMAEAKHLARAPSAPSAGSDRITDDLVRLAGLRDSGALTDAEFEEQKARLLKGEPTG